MDVAHVSCGGSLLEVLDRILDEDIIIDPRVRVSLLGRSFGKIAVTTSQGGSRNVWIRGSRCTMTTRPGGRTVGTSTCSLSLMRNAARARSIFCNSEANEPGRLPCAALDRHL